MIFPLAPAFPADFSVVKFDYWWVINDTPLFSLIQPICIPFLSSSGGFDQKYGTHQIPWLISIFSIHMFRLPSAGYINNPAGLEHRPTSLSKWSVWMFLVKATWRFCGWKTHCIFFSGFDNPYSVSVFKNAAIRERAILVIAWSQPHPTPPH